MIEQTLSIFPADFRKHVMVYTTSLSFLFKQYDVVIFMARKAICFYQALVNAGLVERPENCQVYSSRILNYNIYNKLFGKKVLLVEDVMVRGVSVRKANEYLKEKGISCDTFILARTHSDNYDICRGLSVIGSDIEYHKEDIHRFSKLIADFIEANMCPYNIDQPIYSLFNNSEEIVRFVEKFKLSDIASDLQNKFGISNYLININNCFSDDDTIKSVIDLCKIRFLYRKTTNTFLAIPFVLMDEITPAVLDEMFCRLVDVNKVELVINENQLILRENKLKIVHYLLSSLLMDSFLEFAHIEEAIRLDECDDFVFAGNIFEQVNKRIKPIQIYEGDLEIGFPYDYEFINNEYLSITFDYLYSDNVYYKDYYASCNKPIINEILILEDLKRAIKSITGKSVNGYIFSHILDTLIDKGYIIPSVIHKQNGSIIRAYKCGEVYALNEEHYNLFAFGLQQYLEKINHKYLGKTEFEKLCVLFFRELVNSNFLPQYQGDNPDGYSICYSKFGPRVSTTKPIYSAEEKSTLANKLLKIQKIEIPTERIFGYIIKENEIKTIENKNMERMAKIFFSQAGLVYCGLFRDTNIFNDNRNMFIRTYVDYLTLMAIGENKKDQLLSLLAELYLVDQIKVQQDFMKLLNDCANILDGLVSGMWKYICYCQKIHPIEYLYNSLEDNPDQSIQLLSYSIAHSFSSNPDLEMNRYTFSLINEAGKYIFTIAYLIWFLLKKYKLYHLVDNMERSHKREFYYINMRDIRKSQQDYVNSSDDVNDFKNQLSSYQSVIRRDIFETYNAHVSGRQVFTKAIDQTDEEVTMDKIEKNLNRFWNQNGEAVVAKYKDRLMLPIGKAVSEKELNKKLSQCEFLILTANPVEGAIITQSFMSGCHVEKPEKITADSQLYQFFTFKGHRIAHIIPLRTSSFSEHGSADAVSAAINHVVSDGTMGLKAIFSLGVAYGITPKTNDNEDAQDIGDVLVSNRIVRWDAFNKLTDGKMDINDRDSVYIGDEILGGCQLYLKNRDYPSTQGASIGQFRWFLGTLLSGNMVLSDKSFRQMLLSAADKYGIGEEIVGGEMEGSGIWYARRETNVPIMIIKGICDWGANKNGWDFVSTDKREKSLIKDCVQALCCENAFRTFEFIVSQVYGEE